MSEISERIKSRLDRSKGLTQANLARFCGVSTGPEYELKFSAGGNGADEPEWEEVNSSRPVWYEIEELRQYGVNPERCKRARVTGDSMEPTLASGDVVLWAQELDSRVGCVHILDGCIYVMSIEGTYKIKRLSRIKNGLSVMSDNPRYSTEVYTGEECENIRIYGRVLEFKRSL